MEYVQINEVPDLDSAIFVGAFGGWNDAAGAATWAVKFLINQWEARAFAEIEPELFFDFSETRPRVRISGGLVRRLNWPSNRFYVHRAERVEGKAVGRDIVLFLGEEPQLRWKTFAQEMLDVCRQCQVEEVVLLGALVGEVAHTTPVQVSGTSGEPATLRRMEAEGVLRAQYEGTTGILSIIQDTARKEGFSTASLWGMAPHYVSAAPNLAVSEALLAKLDGLYTFQVRLAELSRAARRFTQRVSSLVADDPEVAAYVRELESRSEDNAGPGMALASDASGVHRIPMDGDLPSPEEAIQDVEEWLRQYRGDGGDA